MSDKLFKKLWSKTGLKLAPTAMAVLLFSGCASTQNAFDPPLNSEFSISSKDVVLVDIDVVEREQYQVLIGQMTGMLAKRDITHEQKAQLLYQMGILYDRLGMDATARTMFMNSLVEVPDFARAYNFLGIYLASNERFGEAYDAYDAVLEIDPNEVYAYFNRGIALYYGNRAELGIQDLKKFYELDKNDPFRIAWLYILERKVEGQDVARTKLEERHKAIDKKVPWGTEVLDFLAGKISGHELIASVRTADIEISERARRLCEAYFYMAKEAAYNGEYKRAYDLFHLCLSTNVSGYLEYRYARMEIARFERMEKVAQAEKIADMKQQERDEFLKKQADEAHQYFENLENTNLKDKQSKATKGETEPQADAAEDSPAKNESTTKEAAADAQDSTSETFDVSANDAKDSKTATPDVQTSEKK